MPAQRNQTRNVIIGTGIIAVLALITVLVFFAPNLYRLFQPSIDFVALIDDAGALQKESPVWLAGREVGVVVSVGFRPAQTDSAERIAIRLRVPKKYAPQIRRDSEVRITSRRTIGEPILDITPGSAAAPALRHMDSLHVRPRGTMISVLENSEILEESFEQLFAEMRAYKAPAKRRATDLERLDRQLNASIDGVNQLVAALNVSPLRTFSEPAWSKTVNQLAARTRELSAQLEAAGERARAAHSDASPSLERLAAHADTISSILAELDTRVKQGGGGLLIRAQRDSAISKGLHRAQQLVDSLIAETKRNPLRFWF